jgi:hypothetical protein
MTIVTTLLTHWAMRFYQAVAIAVAFSLALVTPLAAQTSESEQIQDIVDEVSEIRGLTVKTPITVTYKSRDELQSEVDSDFFEDYTEADSQRDQRSMIVFGIIDPDQDIRDLYSQLYGGQIAGYYDPTTAELVVVKTDDDDESLSAMEEFTLAHEINHALQDQHFDIDAGAFDTSDATDDVSLASSGLVEGDATLLQGLYLRANPKFTRALSRELSNSDSDDDSLDAYPPVIVDLLLFPYEEGYEFVDALYDEGGYDLVNQAFENPPVSTEQILHPDKYLDGEVGEEITVADPLPALGDGWVVSDQNAFGEFLIKSLLASDDETEDDAEDAAAGWNGDAYTVAANGDQSAVVWQSAWDSDDDAAGLAETFAAREASRFDADVDEDDGLFTIEGDEVTVLIKVDESNVTYVQAPDLETAHALLDGQTGQ